VALGLAGNAVLARRYREVDMTPGLLSGGLLGALIGAAFGDFSSVQPTDYGWLFLQGGVCVALAYLLLSRAPRYIPAPEVSLIMLLESFLGPFWVWLLLAEVPPSSTIYGGLLVLTTMVLYTLSRLHGARRAAQLRKAPVA
jgi:drug/metabolite transporter (DMT)-like permease